MAAASFVPVGDVVHQVHRVRDELALPAVVRLETLPDHPLDGLGQLLRALGGGIKDLGPPVPGLLEHILVDAQQGGLRV